MRKFIARQYNFAIYYMDGGTSPLPQSSLGWVNYYIWE